MAFTKQLLERQTIKPSLPTSAIDSLVKHLSNRFSNHGWVADDKPEVFVCFDTSGSGKTTTVREAARSVGANRVIISPNLSPVLAGVLLSCCNRNQFEIDENGFISATSVEERFKVKFHAALEDLLGRIISLIQQNDPDSPFETTVDEGAYSSPNSSITDIRQLQKNCASVFKELREVLGKRNLVIHVDDCQHFFNGVIPLATQSDTLIPAEEIMSLALRSFSKCITPFANNRNIVWVFSGTRPNLLTEITLTSGLVTIDLSEDMTDFNSDHILKILGNYFDLSLSDDLTKLCKRLCGPPKLVYFFLKAASKHHLTVQQDLIDKWAHIEESAIALFKTKIDSTFIGDLDQVARNLSILHSSAVALDQDYIEIAAISRHLINLVEAGLLRIHKRGRKWHIFTPNRFLVEIFSGYVRWYTWERLEMLKSLIQASSLTKTQNGKVFEYLFALELCNAPNCKMWSFISESVDLQPLYSWNPKIEQMKNLGDCTDTNCIYVMVDPDRGTSKVDLVFFAKEKKGEERRRKKEVVRVLVQLTVSTCGPEKVIESFNCMMDKEKVETNYSHKDYRLFVGPKSKADVSNVEKFEKLRCFMFLEQSGISGSFELPFEQLCDPKSTENSIRILVQMAEHLGDADLANQLAGDFASLSISNKRQRVDEQVSNPVVSFDTMDEFYTALESKLMNPAKKAQQLALVKQKFDEQDIEVDHLPRLIDEKLKEAGIVQLGLRESILAVLGK